MSCPIRDCFYARALPVFLTPFSLLTVLGFAAKCLRHSPETRTHVRQPIRGDQAYGTAQLALLKLLVKSVCVLAAIIAIAVSFWISLPLLGDAVFIQIWGVPLSSQRPAIKDAIAALTGYEQLSLVVVAAVGVVIWVAAFAVRWSASDPLFPSREHRGIVAAAFGLALALLGQGHMNGIVSPFVFDAIFSAARWIFLAAMALTTVYVCWSGFAERVLTIRYASGAVAMSAAFGAAWLTVLHMAGVQLAGMSAMNAVSILSPALLPLLVSVLAPWSLSRVRHT